MPYKDKSSLSRSSSRARAAKIVWSQEPYVHAKIRIKEQRKQQDEETISQSQERLDGQVALQTSKTASDISLNAGRATKIPEQTQMRKKCKNANWIPTNFYAKQLIHI